MATVSIVIGNVLLTLAAAKTSALALPHEDVCPSTLPRVPFPQNSLTRRARSYSDTCFVQQMGECRPGEAELGFHKCFTPQQGGCACCAMHCASDPDCAGFTWHEDEGIKSNSCPSGAGMCRLKSRSCKSDGLIKMSGSMWFAKEYRSLLSDHAAEKCVDAEDVVMRKTTREPIRTTAASDYSGEPTTEAPEPIRTTAASDSDAGIKIGRPIRLGRIG